MKKIIFSIIVLIFFMSSIVVCAEEETVLKPTINLENIEGSSDYFGLELKWRVNYEKITVIYMDPELYLAYIRYKAEKENWSIQEKEQKKKKILNLMKKFLIFKVIRKENNREKFNEITKADVCLIDDSNNKYFPEDITNEEANLNKSYSDIFYLATSYLYFPKYQANNNELILKENTKWIKIELKTNGKTENFEWVFGVKNSAENTLGVSRSFYSSFKIFLLVLLILQTLLFLTLSILNLKVKKNIRRREELI